MKKILMITATCIAFGAAAQQTKGQVSYDVFVTSDDPQSAAYVDQMKESTMELFFDEGKIRSELFLGDFMTTTTINRKENDSTLTLVDGMMGKIATKVTENDLDDERKLALSKRKIDLIEGETKEVMGYNCKKAIITTEDENETVVWYTEELLPTYRYGQYLYEEIPGVPLNIQLKWGTMNLELVAFEFSKKIKKAEEKFSMEIPKGYTFRSMEEMRKMRRGQ